MGNNTNSVVKSVVKSVIIIQSHPYDAHMIVSHLSEFFDVPAGCTEFIDLH